MSHIPYVLVRSDLGDGGWSLHAPGATDDAIATGAAPALVTGPATWQDGAWSRPDARDYAAARAALDGVPRVPATPRAKIRQTTENTVTLTYEDERGELVTREFAAIGGEVREYDERGYPRFVGARLSPVGWSLGVRPEGLLETIRREYRAMRRAERRERGW